VALPAREAAAAGRPAGAVLAGRSGVLSSVAHLVLAEFRNYTRMAADFAPGPVVLTGPNGAGKTNLLEAISLLSPGRGLRGAGRDDLARAGGTGGWAVAARVNLPDGPHDVGTGIDAANPGGRRRARLDGGDVPVAALGAVRVVWLTPAMDRLFIESPGGRRRFLDRLVLAHDPRHAERHTAFDRALKERLRLLKDGVDDDRWLTALEATLAEAGTALAAARRLIVARLSARLEQEHTGPFPHALLSLAGVAEEALANMETAAVMALLADGYRRARPRDAAAGRSTFGPQTTDLLVTHAGKNRPAADCSTGEQKALLLSLVLAHAGLEADDGPRPILLLDEVAAHLDEARRAALYDRLVAMGLQAFLTGTDFPLFDALGGRAQFLTVRDGAVGPVASGTLQ